MKSYTTIDLIRKLVGSIEPVGDSSIDPKRLENLREQCQIVDGLIEDIEFVSRDIISQEHSVHLAGKTAKEFLKNLKDTWFCEEEL